MNLNILYEDNHIIVCVKPQGIATQGRRVTEPDMVSLLKNHISRNQQIKGEPYLAIIHRLDQPVEGLLVFAKTPFAAKELNHQLTKGSFGKHYQAIVSGIPQQPGQPITDYLIKDGRTNTSRVCTANTPGAKKAVLTYRLLSHAQDNACLIEIQLETGRHHQIRVQMAHQGCPILGDTKYNPNPYPNNIRVPLALCAHKLKFNHPKTKKQMVYEITPSFRANR